MELGCDSITGLGVAARLVLDECNYSKFYITNVSHIGILTLHIRVGILFRLEASAFSVPVRLHFIYIICVYECVLHV